MSSGQAGPPSARLHCRRAPALLLALLLGVAALRLAADWRLEKVAGQTIPRPTRTPTSTPFGMATHTPTWTPRPTWTRVLPTEPPTAEPTGLPIEPTATPTLPTTGPTSTAGPHESRTPPAASLTPTPTLTTAATPSTPAQPPHPLVFEVVLLPQVAGPGDIVTFIVQAANVGYLPLADIRVASTVPALLAIESADCTSCLVQQRAGGTGYLLGSLDPGQQVILAVTARVVNDAWPGQLLRTEWTIECAALPAQTVAVELTLPWAPLPATGSSD